MSRAVVLAAVRTPIGRYGGALSAVRPDDLAARAIAEAVERSGVSGEQIEDVYFGAANQAGEDNRNVARMAALLAGLPDSVAGVTMNRLCASGLAAVVSAGSQSTARPATVAASPSAAPAADPGPALAGIDRSLADLDTQLTDADHDVATPEGDLR